MKSSVAAAYQGMLMRCGLCEENPDTRKSMASGDAGAFVAFAYLAFLTPTSASLCDAAAGVIILIFMLLREACSAPNTWLESVALRRANQIHGDYVHPARGVASQNRFPYAKWLR